MIPLFNAFGFSVETDENGAIIGDNQAYTINGDGLLYVTDSNPSMPILDDDGAYIIDVLIEKAPFWKAQQEAPLEDSNFITDRINNICIDKGFPELVIPLNYNSTFFNSIKNNEIIIESTIDSSFNTGIVSGFTYTDSNNNIRRKYETIKALSSGYKGKL